MLIVYGATAGVSVVKLYAGAFFPGIMLATLYVLYVIVIAKWKPHLAPPMSAEERFVPLPPMNQQISESISDKVVVGLVSALKGKRNTHVSTQEILKQLGIALLPLITVVLLSGLVYFKLTAPLVVEELDPINIGKQPVLMCRFHYNLPLQTPPVLKCFPKCTGILLILIGYCIAELIVHGFPDHIKISVLTKNGRDE
jgi:TRAP-type mannitol/chloroaromatic compound transport system permease large subunit